MLLRACEGAAGVVPDCGNDVADIWHESILEVKCVNVDIHYDLVFVGGDCVIWKELEVIIVSDRLFIVVICQDCIYCASMMIER